MATSVTFLSVLFRWSTGAAHPNTAAVTRTGSLQRWPAALPLHCSPGGQCHCFTLASQWSSGDLQSRKGSPVRQQCCAWLHFNHKVIVKFKYIHLFSQFIVKLVQSYNELSKMSSFSELILFNVHVEASGEWECVVSTGRGNTSHQVEIVVLENSAPFCPEDKVFNSRGEFRLDTEEGCNS